MDKFVRGSEWNRWDLHFHTPSSYDYGDKSVTNQEIIDCMIDNAVKVFAVTDHHVIDVERYQNLKALGEKQGICVLPGIEFLGDARGKEPIHYIAIFSEESDVQYIWDQLRVKTAIDDVRSKGSAENEVYCVLKDTVELVHELGGVVSIHAGAKHGSVENITNSLPHAMAQKKDIAELVDIYELGKESDQSGYKDIVFPAIGSAIPMIICSDNHNIKKYIIKQKLWIKGSPNFEGLKYALTEPEDRFLIGDKPEVITRVEQNKTKYISSLKIHRTGKEDKQQVWFDSIEIPLNSELVTVIGNKGSGKSAISDIISLCCDAEHSEDYLFLHKDKFNKKGFSDRFSASVSFKSGISTKEIALSSNIDTSSEPLVRYLPQTYFEKVCNEIGKVEAFRGEIEKVVFQYVPIHERLGRTDFKSLVNYKKEAVDREIISISEKIDEANLEIIALEDKADPEYKKSLINKKKVKAEELHVHKDSKPAPISNPADTDESDETKELKAELKSWQDKKIDMESSLQSSKDNIAKISLKIEDLCISS